MIEFGRNMKIILYDEETMRCFGGHFLGFEMEEPEQIDATTLEDTNQRIIRRISKTTAEMTCELSYEIIQLDPKTMRRISRFNFEKENEKLLKDIEEYKNKIENLKTEYEELKTRLQAITDIGADIWENGTEYKKESDDWEF